MNKQACDIAQDLMPIELDGLSREGSKSYLQEHLAQCEPCRRIYDALRQSPQSEPAQLNEAAERLALARGMRQAGRRIRLWKKLLILCASILLILALIGLVQLGRWHFKTAVPLDDYELSIASYEAQIHMDMIYYVTHTEGVQTRREISTDPNLNPQGAPEALILTYEAQYYPARAETERMISPSSVTAVLDYSRYCLKDGGIYTVASSEIAAADGLLTADHVQVVLQPGMPVKEIRVTDGRETRVVYTWGDEIPQRSRWGEGGMSNFVLAE